jgi:hypothetical protein
MAYGNWGAWVFRNGEHMPQWEDQTPYREEDASAGYLQAFGGLQPDGTRDQSLSPQHAVLGGKEMRLCGYKSYPSLFHRLEPIDLTPFIVDDDDEWNRMYDGELDGYRFRAVQFDHNMVDLFLLEPDGAAWSSRCGYCYGSGHHDSPSDDAGWPDEWRVVGGGA